MDAAAPQLIASYWSMHASWNHFVQRLTYIPCQQCLDGECATRCRSPSSSDEHTSQYPRRGGQTRSCIACHNKRGIRGRGPRFRFLSKVSYARYHEKCIGRTDEYRRQVDGCQARLDQSGILVVHCRSIEGKVAALCVAMSDRCSDRR